MTDITWPEGLRNSLQSAKVWDRPSGARISPVASGPAFVEPYSEDVPTTVDVQFRFTRDEARVYDAFVSDMWKKMNSELPEFNFPIRIPDTNVDTQVVRWLERPAQRTAQAGNVYTYTGTLLIRRLDSRDLDNPDAILAIGLMSGNRDLDRNMGIVDTALNGNWPEA